MDWREAAAYFIVFSLIAGGIYSYYKMGLRGYFELRMAQLFWQLVGV